MKDHIIYSFKKNNSEEVCASILNKDDKGKFDVNLRIYFKDDNNEFKPSQKGITLSSDLLFELETAIDKLKEKINQKRLF